MFVILVCALVPLLLLCFLRLALAQRARTPKCARALLVVAHPDDETMFFSLSIHGLTAAECELHVLCLSNGNANGLGKVRRDEMYKACAVYQIPARQVTVAEDPALQDGFHEWDTGAVALHVLRAVRAVRPDLVLTFDGGGVSGHPNHTSVYRALRELVATHGSRHPDPVRAQGQDPEPHAGATGGTPGRVSATVYTLVTTPLLRKYSGLLDVVAAALLLRPTDLPFTWLGPGPGRGPARLAATWRAMARHRSQLVWYRYLFLLLSSYTYTSTLWHLGTLTVELERRPSDGG